MPYGTLGSERVQTYRDSAVLRMSHYVRTSTHRSLLSAIWVLVAQWLECLTGDQKVARSIPVWGPETFFLILRLSLCSEQFTFKLPSCKSLHAVYNFYLFPLAKLCTFETDWCGFVASSGLWARSKGRTTSIGTGPSVDHTTGSANGESRIALIYSVYDTRGFRS